MEAIDCTFDIKNFLSWFPPGNASIDHAYDGNVIAKIS
ncbi:hypothetical protein PsAD14_03601 [Pseudovibrio sp. Ad14]|nr:hypothetical protein PsW74_04599 [Pseudovibrio sp. W74]KZL07219.1 hypothetical protein PsAD14_03601 [Pseudovibrio sp. Ad14]